MKREIIFRGKRVDNGEWVYGRGLQQCKDELGNEIVAIFTDIVKSEKYIKKEGRYTLYYVPVKAETLGQYTGLKDKNGKKIFEGDIVEFTNLDLPNMVIRFDNGSFMLCEDEYSTYEELRMNYVVEVIGNIHDNPELIE